MIKLFSVIMGVVILLGVGWLGVKVFNHSTSIESSIPEESRVSPAYIDVSKNIHELQTQQDIPKKLIIPKLGIDTVIEPVGMDENRQMEVPTSEQQVAWFALGYKPGEEGNSVIAGHYDTKTGAPSVFFSLNSLRSGDEITIIDSEGDKLLFEVTDHRSYAFDQFPMQEIFGTSSRQRLNLITCDGVFDASTKNYSQRYVVVSERSSL